MIVKKTSSVTSSKIAHGGMCWYCMYSLSLLFSEYCAPNFEHGQTLLTCLVHSAQFTERVNCLCSDLLPGFLCAPVRQQPAAAVKPGGDYQNQNEYLNGFQF